MYRCQIVNQIILWAIIWHLYIVQYLIGPYCNECHDDLYLGVKLRRHIRSGPPKPAPATCYWIYDNCFFPLRKEYESGRKLKKWGHPTTISFNDCTVCLVQRVEAIKKGKEDKGKFWFKSRKFNYEVPESFSYEPVLFDMIKHLGRVVIGEIYNI